MVNLLGESKKLLGKFVRGLQLPAYRITSSQPYQHLDQLGVIFDVLTQRMSTSVDMLYFWSGIPLCDHERCAQGDLQVQLLLDSFRRFRELQTANEFARVSVSCFRATD